MLVLNLSLDNARASIHSSNNTHVLSFTPHLFLQLLSPPKTMSRKPPPRDPNAPKRNLSAYLLYQNQMRETFKSQNPGMTFGQLSKYTSAMYAELNPDEKLVWVQHAEEDKKRYLHELANYNPPPGYDTKGDAIVSFLTQPTIRPSKGFPRDPKAPKRNLSAYLVSMQSFCSSWVSNAIQLTHFEIIASLNSYIKTPCVTHSESNIQP